MLSRDQLESYERMLMKEIATRRSLGGYSPDAATIQMLCEVSFELVRHLKEKMPMPKVKKVEEE